MPLFSSIWMACWLTPRRRLKERGGDGQISTGSSTRTSFIHAHGRRTAETIATVAPHLDAQAEALALEDDEVTRGAEITPLPGAHDLLRQLVDGSWAIVTSGPRVGWPGRLSKPVAFPSPGALVTGDDVAIGKPHPEGYVKAAQLLGVAAADCIVFEDAPAGIEAARASGAVAIALTTTYGVADLDGADSHIDTLAQVSATIATERDHSSPRDVRAMTG